MAVASILGHAPVDGQLAGQFTVAKAMVAPVKRPAQPISSAVVEAEPFIIPDSEEEPNMGLDIRLITALFSEQ